MEPEGGRDGQQPVSGAGARPRQPNSSSQQHRQSSGIEREVELLRRELGCLRTKVQDQESEIHGLREDCGKEREAHNATKRRLEETRMDLIVVRRQLEVFQVDQVARIRESRQAAMDHYREEYERGQALLGLNPEQASGSAGAGAMSEEGGDLPDSGRIDPQWQQIRVRSDSEGSSDSGVGLECPMCQRMFDSEDPESFTSHTESCQA